MTAKSILDIDVNDSAFLRFKSLYDEYQQKLSDMPRAWQGVSDQILSGVDNFRELVALEAKSLALSRLNEKAHAAAVRLLMTEEEKAAEKAQKQAKYWQDIRRSTVGAATNIKDITGQLLKWGALTGTVSGLLGAGGLFGITRLAEGVATGRRSALGLGVSYGQQKAFGTAYDRLVDPDAVLQGVEGSLTKNRGALYSAGLRDEDLAGGAAAVASRLIDKLKKLADQTPENLLGFVHESRQLGNLGISEEDFRRLRRTQPGEVQQVQQTFSRLSGDYNLTDPMQRQYQEFVTTLQDAKNQVETVFVKALGDLTPELRELSKEVVGLVKALSESGTLKDVLVELTDAVRQTVKFFRDPAGMLKQVVKDDLNRELDSLKKDKDRFFKWLGAAPGDFTRGLGNLPPEAKEKANPVPAPKEATLPKLFRSGEPAAPPGTMPYARAGQVPTEPGPLHPFLLKSNIVLPGEPAAKPALPGPRTAEPRGEHPFLVTQPPPLRLELPATATAPQTEPTPRGAATTAPPRPDHPFTSPRGPVAGVLAVKPGAGTVDPGLGSLAQLIYSQVPGIERATSFNDVLHRGTGSAHSDNRAFDLTVRDPAQAQAITDLINRVLAREKVPGRAINEYDPARRSPNATAGHIHIQTDVNVSQLPGSNVIVSTQQVVPPT